MALQILQLLAAIAAVLRPGGWLVATMPDTRGLTLRDKARWLRLVAALKGPLPSGNDQRELPTLLARAGLQLTEDASWRFALPIRTHEDAKELVESVYLPGFGATEIARASAVAARWREAAMSIRRLVAHRPA
jgi:DNA-binding transcriptional regulator/RsmH inhibitor MraZ